MLKNFVITLGALLLVLTGGCFCGSSTNPQTYELLSLEQYPAGRAVEIGSIKNLTPGLLDMIYIDAGAMVIADDSRRWAQTPDRLLQRYLLRALSSTKELELKGESISVRVEVDIFDFCMDVKSKQAVLGVKYSVGFRQNSQGKKEELIRSVTLTEPCTDLSAESFAVAMSRCASRLAAAISVDINSQKQTNK